MSPRGISSQARYTGTYLFTHSWAQHWKKHRNPIHKSIGNPFFASNLFALRLNIQGAARNLTPEILLAVLSLLKFYVQMRHIWSLLGTIGNISRFTQCGHCALEKCSSVTCVIKEARTCLQKGIQMPVEVWRFFPKGHFMQRSQNRARLTAVKVSIYMRQSATKTKFLHRLFFTGSICGGFWNINLRKIREKGIPSDRISDWTLPTTNRTNVSDEIP